MLKNLFKNTLLTLFLSISSCTIVLGSEVRAPLPNSSCIKHTSIIDFESSDKQKLTQVCQEGYFVYFDSKNHLPKITFYNLTPNNAIGCFERSNQFQENTYVIGSAEPSDYKNSGFDKGHLVPDGDQTYSLRTEEESFLMTNMAPQAPSFNRGIWKLLEASIRSNIQMSQDQFIIITGSDYNDRDSQVSHKIRIPHAFYKILVNLSKKEYWIWYIPHTKPYPTLGNDIMKFRVPLKYLETQTKLKFKFSSEYREVLLDRELEVDFKGFNHVKHKACGINVKE